MTSTRTSDLFFPRCSWRDSWKMEIMILLKPIFLHGELQLINII